MMSPEHLVMPGSKEGLNNRIQKNINRSVSEEHRNQGKELGSRRREHFHQQRKLSSVEL